MAGWESIVDAILAANSFVNSVVWGMPMIILLVATGIVITIFTGFVQIRKFPVAVKTMLWRGGAKGEVHPFKVWCMVSGATVGVGNIAGVSTAIAAGGPGALFWMWICGLLGMGIKAVEVTLSMWSRKTLPDGRIRGGTMYYIEKVPKIGAPLAILFSLFAWLCAFGIGNMVQANSVALGAVTIADAFGYNTPDAHFMVRVAIGLIIAFFTGLVILGGIKRIAEAAFILVPFMSIWYIIFGVGIWISSGPAFFEGLSRIFHDAFSGTAAIGGFAGASVFFAIRYGFARGLFSNEAGLGSAPLAYAYAESDHPGRQGFYGIFEVFWDTIVICTITGIAVVVTGAWTTGYSSTQLAMEAFTRTYGVWAAIFLGVALMLFAYTTILTWSFYGENTFIYFMCEKAKIMSPKVASYFYRLIWLPPLVLAAVLGREYLGALWDLADTLNGLMAIPNLIAIVVLAPVAVKLLKDFYSRYLAEISEAAVSKGMPGKLSALLLLAKHAWLTSVKRK